MHHLLPTANRGGEGRGTICCRLPTGEGRGGEGHHLLPTATPSSLTRTFPSIPLVQIGIELHMAPNYDSVPKLRLYPHIIPLNNSLAQIGIELHMAPNYFNSQRTSIHMSVLFLHMANLGYAPYSRDDNFHGDCCSEYSFLRVEM